MDTRRPDDSLGYLRTALGAVSGADAVVLYAAAFMTELLLFGAIITGLPFLLTATFALTPVYVGLVLTTSEVSSILAPIRALGTPGVDLLAEQPYTRLQSFLDMTNPKGMHYYWKTEFAAELSDDMLSTMRDLAAECPIPGAQLLVFHVDGSLNERDGDDGAVGNRDVRFIYGVNGKWEPDEPNAATFTQWVHDAWVQLRPFSTGGNYINFQTDDDDEERIKATYGTNFEQLVAVKHTYDPDNLFRSNRNIEPRA